MQDQNVHANFSLRTKNLNNVAIFMLLSSEIFLNKTSLSKNCIV